MEIYSAADGMHALCRNADTLKRLQEAEKKLKGDQVKAYIDLDLSNKEREAGNQVWLLSLACSHYSLPGSH